MSPSQKADLVKLVKHVDPTATTLAIGDGANDVAMIQEADVGVGISGKEGMQAARSADFAFGQFKHLQPLLLMHGRECYRRNADLICWTFYKNILYVIVQFYFGFISCFSGQPLYEPWIYQLYNIAFTSVPIMCYALFDLQHTKQVLLTEPELYRTQAKFTAVKFWSWILYAFWQGLLLIALVFVSSQSLTFTFWSGGMFVYAGCIFIVNSVLLRMTHNFTGLQEAVMFAQCFSFWLILYLQTQTALFPSLYGTWQELVSSESAWLGFMLAIATVFTVDSALITLAKTKKVTP